MAKPTKKQEAEMAAKKRHAKANSLYTRLKEQPDFANVGINAQGTHFVIEQDDKKQPIDRAIFLKLMERDVYDVVKRRVAAIEDDYKMKSDKDYRLKTKEEALLYKAKYEELKAKYDALLESAE